MSLSKSLRILRIGYIVVALLLLVGHMTTWAAHRAAALTLSAHDLAVFTRATPGAGIFMGQWYYLSLWAAALLLALSAGWLSNWWNRLAAGLLCAVVASLGLPGYPQVLSAFRNPDLQFQFFVSLIVMVAVVAAALGQWGRSIWLKRAALVALPLLALVPVVGYLAVKPFIEQLYNNTLGLGLGWWLTLAGVLAGLGLAVLEFTQVREVAGPL
jgi:hypothetical protein